jgi:hypothetical protein
MSFSVDLPFYRVAVLSLIIFLSLNCRQCQRDHTWHIDTSANVSLFPQGKFLAGMSSVRGREYFEDICFFLTQSPYLWVVSFLG